MYSLRLLALAAILAAAAAVPTDKPYPKPVTTITDADIDEAPWFSFPLFGNLFAPLWRLFPSFADIGPRIIADDKKFQVIVNVRDYKKDDLKVKIKKDLIFVQGSHEAKQDERDIYASQFFHTYSLPGNSSAAAVTAELSSDGFLVITAPIDPSTEKSKEEDRDVKIVETGVPLQKEEPTTTAVTATEDDRKEPTTTPASDVTDVTGQDKKVNENEIPL